MLNACKRYHNVITPQAHAPNISAVLSVLCALFGILISILGGTPVGSTIVAVDIVVFALFYIIGLLRSGGK